MWKFKILEISYEECSLWVAKVELFDGTCNFEFQVSVSSGLGLAPYNISAANSFALLPGEYKARRQMGGGAGELHGVDDAAPGCPGATRANYRRLMKGGFVSSTRLATAWHAWRAEGFDRLTPPMISSSATAPTCADLIICGEFDTYDSDIEFDNLT